ncbi:MAG: hypothetical protein J6T73_05125, partial [Clostridia bacterium]|nr:hypothetical protein [Clostridia bacterium]
CGSSKSAKTVKKYSAPDGQLTVKTSELCSNGKYSLSWDDDKKCVIMKDIKNETYWSSLPYSYYLVEEPYGAGMVRMYSPIYIEYLVNNNIRTSYAKIDALNDGVVTAERIENGIRVTYYFTEIEISIPVDYVICKDGLETRLVVEDIAEKSNKIYSVSISPFMCSAKDNTDSYLFVPSGSGTLMYVDDTGRNTRIIQEPVYGRDNAVSVEEKLYNESAVMMPVFGAKSENNGICAIINKGAESARIDAEVGNPEYGYSSVFATFLLRGTNNLIVKNAQGNQTQIMTCTDNLVDTDYFSVKYIPLAPDKANYIGMAEVYREWLKEQYGLKETVSNSSPLCLNFLGGALVGKNMLGISYDDISVATRYSDVKKIVEELTEKTSTNAFVRLIGFGESGLDMGVIANGMELSREFGSYDELIKYCKKNNLPLHIDYDVLGYSKSGNGVRRFSDSAVSANKSYAVQYHYSKSTYLKNNYSFFLVKRSKIGEIVDKLIEKACGYDISGISLSTLCHTSYSGYPDATAYNKLGFKEEVSSAINKVKEQRLDFIAEKAFDYAAVNADFIIGCPTNSSGFDGYDCDVPFYEIVFKGLKPIAVSSLNYAINPQKQFLTAMETGSFLSFTLCENWNKDISNSEFSVFQFSLYENWKDEIVKMGKESKEWLENVINASIVDRLQIADNVYVTRFSNNASIAVNYSSKAVKTPLGTVKPNEYIYVLGEG